MTRAVLSLGTNTTRLLVVRDGADGRVETVEHRQIGTRLGEGLHDAGPLAEAGVARTLAAAREFADVARTRDARLFAIATSAVRRACDAVAFAERFREATGVALDVLEGRHEAEASFRGATYARASPGARIAVLDIGGGSTECAAGRDGSLDAAVSVEIGSVRVAERFADLLGGAPGPRAHRAAASARAAIATALAPLATVGAIDELRCVAGTPLTLAAVASASHVDAMSGTTLARATVDDVVTSLLDCDLAARRAMPGMLAQRADIVVAGGLILSEAMRLLDARAARLESDDLLLGFLLARRA